MHIKNSNIFSYIIHGNIRIASEYPEFSKACAQRLKTRLLDILKINSWFKVLSYTSLAEQYC